jgi:uncharacterized repeat protein (TIGR01451 family)
VIGSFPQIQAADRLWSPRASSSRSAMRLPSELRSVAVALLLTVCGAVAPALAQPVLEGVATSTSGGASSINLGIPASSDVTEIGDLLVAVVGVRINPSTATPAGWTAVSGHAGFNEATCSSDDEGIACQLSTFWKFATGGETSVVISFGAAVIRQAAGAVFRYSSTNTVDPINPVATSPGTSNTPTAPAVVTTENNSRVIQVVVSDTNGGSFPQLPLTASPPNEVFNLNSATPLTRDSIVMGGAEFAEPVAGTNTGTSEWTGGEENWRGSTFVIRPMQTIIDADLSISKSVDPSKVNPGDNIVYTITAANNALSPGDVTGADVDDIFDSSLTCNWTCAPAGAATCAAGGSGNIDDTVNLPIGASIAYTATCAVSALASGTISNTATVVAPVGVNDTDAGNNSAMVAVDINQAPVAQCQNVTVDANASCEASASIDNGSFDPDNDLPLVLSQDPTGPYSLGDTSVELTVTDDLGLSDMCTATVTVQDVSDPVVTCNTGSGTIIPPDAPISFTASATDNCSVASVVVSDLECAFVNGAGKVVNKAESCVVSASGDTVTIDDSGGVGDVITWTATAIDGSGNESSESCQITVLNPNTNP